MRIRTVIFFTFAALFIVAIGFVQQYYRLEICNFISRDGESHSYYVYPDMSADSLYTLMCADYIVEDEDSWHTHSKHMLYQNPKTGYYRFPAEMGNKHLIRRLQLGNETPIQLSFTHVIRTRTQLAGALSKKLLVDSADVIQRLDNPSYMAQYGLTPETAVCMFIPNTYEVYWTTSVDKLFARMYKEYQQFWNEERRAKAQALGLTPVEVATLASIVASETNKTTEHPLIASLYLNRLNKGIALQACPTVIFAVGDFKIRRVLKRHLRIDSPYNTYTHQGLPPGPIRLPRPDVMDAVLNAPKTDYLYMCANPDFSGTHVFSSSYSKHSAVARQYQRELNNRRVR